MAKAQAKKATKKSPKTTEQATKGFAQHPMLIGMLEKDHARLVRASAKAGVSKATFVRTAVAAAVAEVL